MPIDEQWLAMISFNELSPSSAQYRLNTERNRILSSIMHETLERYGFDDHFASAFASSRDDGSEPARVIRHKRGEYLVAAASGHQKARLAGRLRLSVREGDELPAIGDWVAVSQKKHKGRIAIQAVLRRKSAFARKAAGEVTRVQVVAANIDFAFVVTGLDEDYSVRRVERYVTLAWDSGATPVVLLNKTDVCEDTQQRCADIAAAVPGVDVVALSATRAEGIDVVETYLQRGVTGAFLGSSGVGKSTIVNALAGRELMKTATVRPLDSKGYHTTTHRELFELPGGGLVIDTPGMRELHLWGTCDGLDDAFSEIVAIAKGCRFRNCRHEAEPGCAVKEALERKTLEASRLQSYLSLRAELENLEQRREEAAKRHDKLAGRQMAQLTREVNRLNIKRRNDSD